MKAIVDTREELQPAELVTIETTRYECEEQGCDFKTEDEAEANLHHGKTHAVKAALEAGGEDLRWFESDQDAKAWLHAEYDGYQYRVFEVDWAEPGWYRVHTWTKRCPRGCCDDYCVGLQPIEWKISEIEREIERKQRYLDTIREAIEERGRPCEQATSSTS